MSTSELYKLFSEACCVWERKRPSKRQIAEAKLNECEAAFVYNSRKSRQTARQLRMPRLTVHKIMQKLLELKSYKYELKQHVGGQT